MQQVGETGGRGSSTNALIEAGANDGTRNTELLRNSLIAHDRIATAMLGVVQRLVGTRDHARCAVTPTQAGVRANRRVHGGAEKPSTAAIRSSR